VDGELGFARGLELGVVERDLERVRVVLGGLTALHLLDERAHDIGVELRPGAALELRKASLAAPIRGPYRLRCSDFASLWTR
jgi:hypothetical protein